MKTRLMSASLVTLLSAFAAVSAYAAPTDDLAAAAKKLVDASNYSWTSTMEMANSQFPAMPTSGVAEKDGYTVITRSFNGNTSQTVRKGMQVVMQNRDGDWMTGEEMRAQFAGGGGGGGGKRGGGGGGGGGGGRGGFGGFGGGMFGGAANPAETVASLAGKIKTLTSEDGALVATASGDEAASLLAPAGGRGGQGGGQGPAAPKLSSVTVKFWLKEGALAKYTTHSVGTMTLPNGDDREFDTTTTVEFKDVGTTKVEVPEAAKKKLAP